MMEKNTTYIADKVSTFYIANNRIYIYDSEFKKQHGGLLYSVDMEGKDMVIIEENMF